MNLVYDYFLPCLYAFLACTSYTLVFNIHGREQLVCGFGGAIGWFIYLLLNETIFAAFTAGAAICVFSEIMARIIRCPATGSLLVALLPLVPGGGIYYAMSYCMAGDIQKFLQPLLHILGIAAALAAGVMLVFTMLRTIDAIKRLRRSA